MKFDCGCVFTKLDFKKIRLDCKATWDLISSGMTKGLFQIEKSLGRRYCKKIAPQSIEELADVISLIRPGCLEAEYREDPKTNKMLSITDTYIKVKNGELEPEYVHESLKPILKNTNGVPIYQEQIMRICTDFAGFDLKMADDARRAIGKKKVKEMEKVKKLFIDGAIRKGHSKELAELIFSWIDKFSGYGFNKSHAVSYAMLGYWEAYAKVHFPIYFFKHKLILSDSSVDKFEEIKELIFEAKLFGIDTLPPSVKECNKDFEIVSDKQLRFGISHIKSVGASSLGVIRKLRSIDSLKDLLFALFNKDKPIKVKKNVIEALIKSGAFDYLGDRVDIAKAYAFISNLTDREKYFLLENCLEWNLNKMYMLLADSNIPRGKNRKLKIAEIYNTVRKEYSGNKKKMILGWESFYLGMPISGSEIELYSHTGASTTCLGFLKTKNKHRLSIASIIEDVRRIKDKNSNEMCFMKISDNTYMLDGVVVFASVYNKIAWIIKEGMPVLISGRKQNNSLLVDSIKHL